MAQTEERIHARRVVEPRSLMLRCVPAVGMAALLVIGGLWSGTIHRDPSPAFLVRWGYDLDALRAGRVHTLFTMTLFPTAHDDWLPMLAQVTALMAVIGVLAGPCRALVAFWMPNIVGTALVSLCVIWPLDAMSVRFAHRWATEPDSGASVGIYGALGCALAFLPRRVRWGAIIALALWLVLAIARERHVWNVEHLAGFIIGVNIGLWFGRGSQHAGPLR